MRAEPRGHRRQRRLGADRGRRRDRAPGAPAGPAAPATRGRGRSGAGRGSAGTGRGRVSPAARRATRWPWRAPPAGAPRPARSHGAPVSEASAPAGGEHHQRGQCPGRRGSWRRSRSSASAAAGPASTRPTPPARSSEARALRQARRSPPTTTCWRRRAGQQRVAVAGQLVGGREGVGVRAQRGPPASPRSPSRARSVGRSSSRCRSRSACEQPGDPPRRDAGADGHGVQAGQVEAAVEPRRRARSRPRSAPRGRRRASAASPDLQRAGAPAQQPGVRLEPGSGRHRRLLRRRRGPGRLWHAAAGRTPSSTGGRTPSGRARGGTRAVLVVPPRG